MGLFGINDNLSTFALTKAKRAERKANELEKKINPDASRLENIETSITTINSTPY